MALSDSSLSRSSLLNGSFPSGLPSSVRVGLGVGTNGGHSIGSRGFLLRFAFLHQYFVLCVFCLSLSLWGGSCWESPYTGFVCFLGCLPVAHLYLPSWTAGCNLGCFHWVFLSVWLPLPSSRLQGDLVTSSNDSPVPALFHLFLFQNSALLAIPAFPS